MDRKRTEDVIRLRGHWQDGRRGESEHRERSEQNSEYYRPKRKYEKRTQEDIFETVSTLRNLFA